MSRIYPTFHDGGCLRAENPSLGLQEGSLSALLQMLEPAFFDMQSRSNDSHKALFAVPFKESDIEALEAVAASLRKTCTDIIVLGTGGSSLGGQALMALAKAQGTFISSETAQEKPPRIHFIDNVDPRSLSNLCQRLDARTTGVLVISKSGKTVETLMQFYAVLHFLQADQGLDDLRDKIIVISDPQPSVLREKAQALNFRILDHDPLIGGRFSVLTNVGLLPALIAGMDVRQLRRGAQMALRENLDIADMAQSLAARGAALNVALLRERGVAITIMMPYMDALGSFADWFCQLWAESLGKKGKGTTPVAALGTVDQHSQLQLYLDGPNDKLITILREEHPPSTPKIPPNWLADPEFAYLEGLHLGDVLDVGARATVQTLKNNGRFVREIVLPHVNEASLGYLFMYYMLETLFTAALLDIDPFGQPMVEEGKIISKELMVKKGLG